jgi:hypothetical protein
MRKAIFMEPKFKKYFKTASPVLIGVFAAVSVAFTGLESRSAVSTAIGSDVSESELRAITVESWDKDFSAGGYGWQVFTTSDTAEQGKPYQPTYSNAMVEREVKLLPGTPRDVKENLNYADAKILAVKFAFTFPGNNVISIKPPQNSEDYLIERARPHFNEQTIEGTVPPKSCFKDPTRSAYRSQRGQFVDCIYGVELPGKVTKVSVWVAGRGNDYTLEGWFEDWKGNSHILEFGSLNYVGWRPLTVTIPSYIPQDVDSFPATKTLVFKQFKIRANPKTSLEPVILYFDELRILTDIFEVHFDGAQIDFDKNDCERKNRLLALLQKNARYPDAFGQKVDCSKAPGPAGAAAAGP